MAGALEPPEPRLIGQKEIDGAILFKRMNGKTVPKSHPTEEVTPFDLRGPNPLPFHILRPSQRGDKVVPGKEHGPVGIRPEPDRVREVIDDARNGASQSAVVIIPVAPHIECAKGQDFELGGAFGDPLQPKARGGDGAAISRLDMNLLSKQLGTKISPGQRGRLLHRSGFLGY